MKEPHYRSKSIEEQYATDYRLESAGVSEINMQDMMNLMDNLPEEKKDEMKKILIDAMKKAALRMLSIAIQDEIITNEEVEGWMKEYNAEKIEIAELIRPFYEKGVMLNSNKKLEKEVYIITQDGSAVWRMRELAKSRFNVGVMTISEAIKILKEKINDKDLR